MLSFSLSAFSAWQQCEAKYNYSYVRRLSPKVKDVASKRGIILHGYLAGYYNGIRAGVQPQQAHINSLLAVLEVEKPKAIAAANTAFFTGNEDLAKSYLDLCDAVERIANRYFLARGRYDAARYEVLMVEDYIRTPLLADIVSNSIIDLVFREKAERGLIWLVEHKSTGNVPSSSVRIRDFQTFLYGSVLKHARGIHVDGVLWNYLRTKEPTIPKLLKAGNFSRDKSIDSTWDTYKRAVLEAGQDPQAYSDMEELLGERETTVFFPRYENVIVVDPDTLMHDYITEASRMRVARMQWDAGIARPIRTLTRDCDWCSFYKLCEAALMGGDEEDLIQRHFTTERD